MTEGLPTGLDPARARRVDQIDWDAWQARDPATLVFIIRDGQILLIRKKRGLGKGKINGPGGRVDPGETPEQCAVRECQEELNITPQNLEYCGQNLFQFTDGYSIHVWTYRGEEFDGEPVETAEAIPHWFDLADIPYDEMWEDDRHWLPLVLARRRFVARYIFEGDRMLDHRIRLVGDGDARAAGDQGQALSRR